MLLLGLREDGVKEGKNGRIETSSHDDTTAFEPPSLEHRVAQVLSVK